MLHREATRLPVDGVLFTRLVRCHGSRLTLFESGSLRALADQLSGAALRFADGTASILQT